MSALDRGRLVHRILQRVWEQLRSKEGLLAETEDGLADIVRLHVSSEIQRLLGDRVLRNPRFAEIEQARLESIVAEWLLLERRRKPFTVLDQEEWRRVAVGGLMVSIRADRMDRLENGEIVILDYKTGECGTSAWFGPRPDEPQLPIYAVTADAPVAGVVFASLKAGKVVFQGLTETEDIVPGVKVPEGQPPLASIVGAWSEVLDRLGRDFRSGRAAVDPKDRDQTCRYCALPSLCRITQGVVELEEADG